MNLRNLTLATMLFCFPALSYAGIIGGYATNGIDDVKIGNYWDDKIKYYIPIDSTGADGQYGVDGYGLSSDSGWTPLGGQVLSMSIFFDIPEGMEGDILTLWFGDLDLKHLSTPTGFFETVNFVDGLGSITANQTIFDWEVLDDFSNVSINDNGIVPPTNSNVSVEISNLYLTGDFWLNLQFTAYDEDLSGYYYNTKEKLSATLHTSVVPEPSIFALFGLGLFGLGFARRRTHN
jgi:hypothetical protein